MAIKRTHLDDGNTDTSFIKLSEYLKKTAVPKYFSKVESSDGVISCYTDNDFLMMTVEYSLSSAGVTIYTRNGMSVNIRTGSSSYLRFYCAYECGSGISFETTHTNGASKPQPSLTITKDESGNTVIISEDKLHSSSSSSTVLPIYIINENSDEISPLRTVRYNAVAFSKTVLAPLVVNGSSGNYTPNVFLQLFDHNNEQGTLDIGGVKYFSNGLWCVKDE